MNKLRAKISYKVIVVAVLIISLITGALSFAGFGWMASEDYYKFEGSIVPDKLSLKLEEVPFELTWKPYYETLFAGQNLSYYLDIEVMSEDTEVNEELLLTTVELDDGRTVSVSESPFLHEADQSEEGFFLRNISISMTDEKGEKIYENNPAERDTSKETYIFIGVDSQGELCYGWSMYDDEFTAECFEYHYIGYEELTEYAIMNCQRLFEPVFQYADEWRMTSGSDVTSYSDVLPYVGEVHDVGDLYGNAAYLIMEKNGDDYAAIAEDVLADYAWKILRSDYYNYGYDESLGSYFVTERSEEVIEPAAVIRCNASLRGDENLSEEMDFYRGLYTVLYPLRSSVIVLGVLSVIACIVCFILMFCYAGWRTDSDRPQRRWIDKIPLEIFSAAALALAVLIVLCFEELTGYGDADMIIGIPLAGAAFVSLALVFMMSIVRRIKTRTLFRNTVCVYAFRLLKKIIAALPSIWVVVIAGVIYGFISILCIASMNEAAIIFWALLSLCIFAAVCIFDFQLESIIKITEKISHGDADCKVDTGKLVLPLKKHGENINSIGDSVRNAVEERLRSERMKTDLIANVSHDIKTPLTSVINYIDLLRHTDITDPTALEYIDVLERQSIRLKRLVQDIVDASKASSGCISAQLEAVDLRELLDQAIAEYSDRMAANSIVPVISVNEDCSGVMADGRLLWRVFDNLLSNICKYSQPGTRAYIKAAPNGENIEIVFMNISSEALDIPAETLMERFVRGDRSRHTDGSGLGLSIAQSLVELQGGLLRLSIEGDMFRAVVVLPACRVAENTAAAICDEDAIERETVITAENGETQAQCEREPLPEDGWLELPSLESGENDL